MASITVELEPPDIEPYRAGNTGIDHVHRLDSGRAGPHVLVNALAHGNEICGAVALDHLLSSAIRPRRGTLTLCFSNTAAYARFDPRNPGASRFVDEDFNRLWTPGMLDGPGDSTERARARELRPVFGQADLLLDVHSMGTFSAPLILCHGLGKERDLAKRVGFPGEIVCGPGHVEGLRLIEYGPFNDPASHRTALLAECGQHWAASTAGHALDTVLRFLAAAGCVDHGDIEGHLSGGVPPRRRLLEVTHGIIAETDRFRFAEDYVGFETFARAGTVVARDGDRAIATPHDGAVLIMPNHADPGRGRKGRFFRVVEEGTGDGA